MKKASKNSTWCEEEDCLISQLVKNYGTKNWAKVAEELDNNGFRKKTGKQCRERWHNHLDPKIIKRSWSQAEEEIMFEEHKKHGNKWTLIALSLPGRTDNAIKNYFYSTIRRSLRRMNKLLGSKNSTSKMRKIKPSTLSKIFSLAEGREEAKTSAEIKNENNELKETCQEILQYLMEFSKWKPSQNNEVMEASDLQKFEKVMQQMTKINELYEDQKAKEAKQKRQRKLEKNFDEAIGMEEDSNLDEEDDDQKLEENDQEFPSDQILVTRSNRKVKPPTHFIPLVNSNKKRHGLEEEEDRQKMESGTPQNIQNFMNQFTMKDKNALPEVKLRQIILEQVECSISEQHEQQSKKSQFNFEIEEENFEMDHLTDSPNFRNTPFALTPTQPLFQKEYQPQPIKNEDCNNEIYKLIMKIQKNSENLGALKESKKTSCSFQSPSSAFRQCS